MAIYALAGLKIVRARSELEARALFDAHIEIAEKKARRFARKLSPGVELNELRAFALIGLLDAARRFVKRDENSHFDRYAHARVLGAIRDGLRGLEWFQRRHANGNPALQNVKPLHGLNMDALPDSSPLADELIDEARRNCRLMKAIKRLPKRERDIVLKHYFHGVPFDQVALKQGVSGPRISQLKKRAFARLREILQNGDTDVLDGR